MKLFRPINLLLGTLSVFITAALMPSWPATGLLVLTLVVVLTYTAAANSLNDYFDYPIDQMNRPTRPLASGTLPRELGWIAAVVLYIGGTAAAGLLSTAAFRIAVFVALPLMALYTPFFKGLPLVGNAVIAVILGLTFLFAGAAFGHLALMWPAAGLAFGFTLVRELIKDIEDVAGDAEVGMGTFAVRYGVFAGVRLARILILFLMAGCILPYILGTYGTTYLVALIIGVEVPLLYTFIYLVRQPNPAGAGWIAKVLKVDIFAGLLAIYLSKFDV